MALNKRQSMVTIILVLLILLVFIWSKLNFTGKNRIISEVAIQIEADSNAVFVNEQEISNYIQNKVGSPVGKSASDVSLTKIEHALNASPYIEKSTAYIGFDGVLKIKVQERKPIIQIKNIIGEEFYLDSFGYQIPKKEQIQPDVIIATGKINIKHKAGYISRIPIANEILELGKFLYYNKFWDLQFEQCYVDNYNRLLLIPRVGSHSIVIDNTQSMNQKFENLRLFYKKGLQTVGWNKYVQIDLSVNNQVIGRMSEVENEQTITKLSKKQNTSIIHPHYVTK
jgi:cell division protein FtsQ